MPSLMVIPCCKMLSSNNEHQGQFLFPSKPTIDGAVRFPFSFLLTYFHRFYRHSLDNCMPNLFRVVGCIEKFNRQFDVKLTHHDINYIHNCCSNQFSANYIKVHQCQLRQISRLLGSNNNLKEEFLKVTGNRYVEDVRPPQTNQIRRSKGLLHIFFFLFFFCFFFF